MFSPAFPVSGPLLATPPSLDRVPVGPVPRRRQYYEGATTSHPRIPGRLFASLPGPTRFPAVRARFAALPCRRRPQQRARIVVQPVIRLARLLRRVDVSGSSQVPRQSILCLCSGPRPRPNRRSLATSGLVGAAPARETAKAPASTDIGATPGLWHLLSTLHGGCCHCPCNTRFRLAGSPLPGGS